MCAASACSTARWASSHAELCTSARGKILLWNAGSAPVVVRCSTMSSCSVDRILSSFSSPTTATIKKTGATFSWVGTHRPGGDAVVHSEGGFAFQSRRSPSSLRVVRCCLSIRPSDNADHPHVPDRMMTNDKCTGPSSARMPRPGHHPRRDASAANPEVVFCLLSSIEHLSLAKDSPDSPEVQPPELYGVIELPQVCGLHHRYELRSTQ